MSPGSIEFPGGVVSFRNPLYTADIVGIGTLRLLEAIRMLDKPVRLTRPPARRELVIPRRADHDLTEQQVVRDLIADTAPAVVVHLAAEVGGIGANMANPGRYFYANAAMGINLIEESRRAGVSKFVQVGTVCAYPKFTPVPFREEDIWDGYPRRPTRPTGWPGEPVRAVGQLRSGNVACDPGPHPQVRDRP